ncbi:hypothetical protein [Gluconobacter japonicus]|uniref:hypothetical protein n=1 Tax=Gluconobacter japonicus TaxID=376620 RepID=UPI000A8AD222|nr:hypothetical protein [Gluconobacter japonicus]
MKIFSSLVVKGWHRLAKVQGREVDGPSDPARWSEQESMGGCSGLCKGFSEKLGSQVI